MDFKLLECFQKKPLIAELPLCSVVLETKSYPWILLIPRRPNVLQMNHLSELDQQQLMTEIRIASGIMEKLFPTDRLNVAAIGNKTPQLHVHIISRTKSDPLWPETVWGQPMDSLEGVLLEERVQRLRDAFAPYEK